MLPQGAIDFRSKLNCSAELIHTMINGYMLSASLFACVEIDLFTHLDEADGLTLPGLVVACGLSEAQVQKLLSFCLSVGLVRKSESRYQNAAVSTRLLSRRSPEHLCAAVQHHQHHVYPLFAHLTEALRAAHPVAHRLNYAQADQGGREFYGELTENVAEFDVFMAAMNTFSRGAGARLSLLLPPHITPVRILDLGGGGGQVAVELAATRPDVQITLVDLARPVAFANAEVERLQLSSRISCVEGDIFSQLALEEKAFDVVLLSAVLGDWSRAYQDKLLDNAHRHLKRDGMLIVSETLLDEDLSGPILPALMSLYVQLLTEGGANFTGSALQDLLSANRFGDIQIQSNRAYGCRDSIIAFPKSSTL
jgi:SAM-dependent methyltransferase